MPPELKKAELPAHIQHTIIVYLATVFVEFICTKGEFPTAEQLHGRGFDDLDYLAAQGWVIQPAGRYARSYQPGAEVKAEMERLMSQGRPA